MFVVFILRFAHFDDSNGVRLPVDDNELSVVSGQGNSC